MALAKLRRIKSFYLSIYILFVVLDFIVDNGLKTEVTREKMFGILYLIFSILFLVGRVFTHVYLLNMAFNMQELLFSYGHLKTRKGNWLIGITYFVFCIGALFNDHLL